MKASFILLVLLSACYDAVDGDPCSLLYYNGSPEYEGEQSTAVVHAGGLQVISAPGLLLASAEISPDGGRAYVRYVGERAFNAPSVDCAELELATGALTSKACGPAIYDTAGKLYINEGDPYFYGGQRGGIGFIDGALVKVTSTAIVGAGGTRLPGQVYGISNLRGRSFFFDSSGATIRAQMDATAAWTFETLPDTGAGGSLYALSDNELIVSREEENVLWTRSEAGTWTSASLGFKGAVSDSSGRLVLAAVGTRKPLGERSQPLGNTSWGKDVLTTSEVTSVARLYDCTSIPCVEKSSADLGTSKRTAHSCCNANRETCD